MSGYGLPRATSSLVTTQSKLAIQSAWFAVFRVSVFRVELVPTAVGTPPACSNAVNSSAPGRSGAPGSIVSRIACRSSATCCPDTVSP